MNKTSLISLIIAGALLSILTAVISLKLLISAVKDEDVTAREEIKTLVTETGEDITITRLGTSSIKKLELEKGYIYFTEGWGVYVPK